MSRRTGDQIVDAVADAATELFARRAPSAVSLREIANAADVNLGLIHRYVGSKDDVIALVLRRHTDRARAAIADRDGDVLGEVAEVVVTRPSTGPLVAGLILDGAEVARIKDEFPLLDHLAERSGPIDAALTYALALGWEVFGPSLLEAVDAHPDDATLTDALAAAMRTLHEAGTP